MSTQTALAITEVGKPLTKISLPIPDASNLKENELIVKITAAGLAPLDHKFRDLNFFNISNRLPAVVSGEIVGTVVSAHPLFPLGTHVFSQALFHSPILGGLQEYTIINALYTAVVPSNISDVEAALYPINAVIAAMALFSVAGFALPFPGTKEAEDWDWKGTKIAIVGAGGNIGKLALQFARLAGVGTIIAIAGGTADAMKALGATHVLSRFDAKELIVASVRELVGDELTFVYDTVSGGEEALSLGVELLSNAKKGFFVHNLPGKASTAVVEKKKGGVVDTQLQGFSDFIPEFGALFWKEFPGWVENGLIKGVGFKVIEGLDEEKINKALDLYREGKGGQRYHVRMG